MRAWTRVLLVLLAAFTGTVGGWAGFAPESFFDGGPVPFLDTGWVSSLPPYNEHLVRDYGFMNLGMTLFMLVAAIRPNPAMVRTSTAAMTVFGLPHLIFHATHLDHLSVASATALMIATVVLTVMLPAIVFLMAGSTRRQVSGAGLA